MKISTVYLFIYLFINFWKKLFTICKDKEGITTKSVLLKQSA